MSYRPIAFLPLFFLVTSACFGGVLYIHHKAEKLPTNLMGPFVVTDDGTIVTVNHCAVHRSTDGGKTWSSTPVLDGERFVDRDERAILRTREGTIVFAFMNDQERAYGKDNKGKWGEGNIEDWVIPCYTIRSTDGGLTWSQPVQFQRRWCGALRCMIQLQSGRIVLVGQSIIPWSHTTLTYVSDDQGQTWKASNEIHVGGKVSHDHDGAMEATILERKDGSLYMLIRTTTGVLHESVSTDGGLTWCEPQPTPVKSSHCCATVTRLSDGRVSMLWNTTPVGTDIFGSREELSIAFSDDDAATWSSPVVVAARYFTEGDSWVNNQVSYPYLCEVRPGVYWITSMFGGLRMEINTKDIIVPKDAENENAKNKLVVIDDIGDARPGKFDELSTFHGNWKCESGSSAVVAHPGDASRIGIHLFGQPEAALVLTLPEPQQLCGLVFDLERWSSTPPFKVVVEICDGNPNSPWKQVYSLDEKTTVGRKPDYNVSFEKTMTGAVRFRCAALESYGALLVGLTLKKSKPMEFLRFVPAETRPIAVPICVRGGNEAIFQTVFETVGNENPVSIDSIKVSVQGSDQLQSMSVQNGHETLVQWIPTEGENVLLFKTPAAPDKNVLQLRATAKPTATVGACVTAWISEIVVDGRSYSPDAASLPVSPKRRIGYYLTKPGDMGVAYYRIPGLVTTNQGTLIAVYDLRHRRGDDLPNDIDIGMSRSTDGGQTWEPMKTILDMGGHDDNEGVGDPAILVDRNTGRIWVVALWAHQGITYHNSLPGLKPGTSGQFLAVTSDDDGLTWSEPVNLTEPFAANLSDPELKTFFDGPGCGITLRDGTLVFPAQFLKGTEKIELNNWTTDYELFVSGCHATILWSKDNGKTWTLGSGVRPKTTEAQVVELNDGSLLLVVRDERKVGTRAMFITRDLGQTWEEHPAGNAILPDPVCQASILRVASKKDGDARDLIAFFNPNSPRGRVDLSLQLSEDEGKTWPHKELCYSPGNWGYSCMCMVDKSTIGVLYETVGGLVFEKINAYDVLENPQCFGK